VFLLLCFGSGAWASVTLPLQGYYRPGRYFPIQVDGTDAASSLAFTADGCLPTQMQAASNGRRTIPMLATGSPVSLRATSGLSIPLRTPSENERLIATALSDVSMATGLFPRQRLLPIRLDPADLLPGPPVAWEALDALLLDADAYTRIGDFQRSALLAGGVMLICTGDVRPDARWPWVARDRVWVLSYAPAGPLGQVVNEDAYLPTYPWASGWSATVRGQVVGVGAVLVIVMVALLLRPNRWTLIAAVLIPVAATIGIGVWRGSLGTVNRAGGDIIVSLGGLTQRDAWVYERSREPADRWVNWSGWTHPYFASDGSIGASHMTLVVTSQGQLRYSYGAAADQTMAFLRREVLPGQSLIGAMPFESPMLDLVKAGYLQHGDKVRGTLPGQPGRWPSVVITAALR
jgi:hypothetical protein